MGEVATTKTTQVATTGVKGLSQFLNSESIKNKFTEILGQKGVGFISSVLSVVNSNKLLKDADQNSIYTSALMAASLDLPINQNLGFAYIVPYNESYKDGNNQWQKRQLAQFQLGYKGFIQLAQRSGQYAKIHSTDIREGELKSHDIMTGELKIEGLPIDKRLTAKIVGYLSYFELMNGFKSTFYMTVEEIEAHAKRYSQSYKSGTGIWKDDFPSMAKKTVTKLNLSKNGPLSIEMQRAVLADQAVIKSDSFIEEPQTLEIQPTYIDNEEVSKEEKVENKKNKMKGKNNPDIEEAVIVAEEPIAFPPDADTETKIGLCKTVEQLTPLYAEISADDHNLQVLYADKKNELSKPNLFDAKNEMK